MAFWGIEVKPGKPVTHLFDKVRRRLRISQATLGIGSAINKSLVQCNVGKKSPVFLCALLPDKAESCHLDLEFEEPDDVVFSVLGPRSVYLTGYYVSGHRQSINSDTESYGEDIANTDTDESGQHSNDDEYEDSFIDDGDPVVSVPSPVPSDGVDEEMLENKKTRERKGSKRLQRKKFQISDSDEETPSQESENDDNYPLFLFKNKKAPKDKDPAVEEKIGRVTVETSESTPNCETYGHVLKEKTDAVTTQTEPKGELGPVNNKKSKRKRKEHSDDVKTLEGSICNHRNTLEQEKALKVETEGYNKHQDILQPNEPNQKPTANMNVSGEDRSSLLQTAGSENGPSSKKRKKKGGIKDRSSGSNDATSNKVLVDDQLKQNVLESDKTVWDLPATSAEDNKPIADKGTNLDFVADGRQVEKPKRKKKDKTQEDKENLKVSRSLLCANETGKPSMSCQVRTLSNGLVIEELALGEQDGKLAALGRKVKVYYTAMLKESGRVFYSNTGKAPYKFRLGDEAIIGGWNVGLEGMRVGGKRRLIIPPSMGYGSRGAGENVPPNSWLVYDVELADIR